ncbi:hypothetical protein EYF80_053438 [Liparis tanakae]|uniref:Uncharacterized protein n=1 Tax=Liparis tanakae TaxID=230148 RepID=A0A4Z2F6I8_9TELE|nr:hypothetical protein EYF80_053438 [Liparis tanakae]
MYIWWYTVTEVGVRTLYTRPAAGKGRTMCCRPPCCQNTTTLPEPYPEHHHSPQNTTTIPRTPPRSAEHPHAKGHTLADPLRGRHRSLPNMETRQRGKAHVTCLRAETQEQRTGAELK